MIPLRPLPRLLLAALLAGCSLNPEYRTPAPPVDARFPDGAAYRAPAGLSPDALHTSAAQLNWRAFFTDPRLRALIGVALRENRDIRTAALNVAQAEARYRLERGDLFPRIGLTGAASFIDLPQSGVFGSSFSGGAGSGLGGSSGAGAASGVGTAGANAGGASAGAGNLSGGSFGGGRMLRFYSAGIGFSSYEIDLFGRLRSLSRAAFEQMLGQEAQRQAVAISVISEVANAYLALRADQELLRVTRETLAAQERSYQLVKATVDAGAGNLLTLRQTETQVDTARANQAQYLRQVAQDENNLALLIGAPIPADLPPGRPFGEQTLMADLPAGIPSEVLAHRPDIVRAERTLREDNAQVGAARAAFFPQILLTASDGLQSLQLRKLFTDGATTWTIAPQLTLPLFTFGRNQAALDVAKLQKRIDVQAYEKAIQGAFREVSDGLTARATYLEQVRQQQALVAASGDAYRLAMMRFEAGVDSYLTTLDAQRTLYGAQQTLIVQRAAQLENLVTLYRALGGGWLTDGRDGGGEAR